MEKEFYAVCIGEHKDESFIGKILQVFRAKEEAEKYMELLGNLLDARIAIHTIDSCYMIRADEEVSPENFTLQRNYGCFLLREEATEYVRFLNSISGSYFDTYSVWSYWRDSWENVSIHQG